jgi:hypothetical protein
MPIVKIFKKSKELKIKVIKIQLLGEQILSATFLENVTKSIMKSKAWLRE